MVSSVVEAGIRRGGSLDPQGAVHVKVPLRAGVAGLVRFRASVHSASQSRCQGSAGECSLVSSEGQDPSYDLWRAA